MVPQWYSHLKSKEEQEKFREYILNSSKVLDRLREICYNMSKVGEEVKSTDYDSPSWAYKQADRNGYLRALKEIQTILTMDKGER